MKEEKKTVKSQIKKAFLELLSEKAYTDITVSDLVNKAQVARMSFYRNFNGLDDLVDSIADDMAQNFAESVLPLIQDNSARKWREYLFATLYRFIQTQKELGVSINDFEMNHTNMQVIMSRVREKMMPIESDIPSSTLQEKYVTVGKMGLIHGIVRKWASTGMRETPEEVIDLIMDMIMKF